MERHHLKKYSTLNDQHSIPKWCNLNIELLIVPILSSYDCKIYQPLSILSAERLAIFTPYFYHGVTDTENHRPFL